MFLTTQFAGAPISFFDLLSMRFRKIDVEKVGKVYIMLRKAKVDVDLKELEAAYLLKHDIENITHGLIVSKQKNIPLTFEEAKDADRKGIKFAGELRKVE